MDILSFMEVMSSNEVPLIAAFFIGLMMAISPCPLATNISAIAYMIRKMGDSKFTVLVGILYTLGRAFTYVSLSSLIVWFGLNVQRTSFFLQDYGEKFLGPFLIIVGILMLDYFNKKVAKLLLLRYKLPFYPHQTNSYELKERLASSGLVGSFPLGIIFALAFCPFSAVLFFGMLIPLAISNGDGIIIPSAFAFATGLPVVIMSFLIVLSFTRVGEVMDKLQTIEKWVRKSVSVIFILVGFYYILITLFLV